MTNWILWSLMFATLVALSALALERIAAQNAWPRRFIWMLAILVIAVVPTALAVRPVKATPLDTATTVGAVRGSSVTMFEITKNSTIAAQPVQLIDAALDVDYWALRIWVLLSVLVFCTFAYSTIALWRKSARWLEVDLKLCRALIANDVGPAVVGFFRPRVVVPQWTLHVSESARQMILRHEVEHLRARDPQALFASGIPLIALPWNLPLWWIVRRMRVAMELDCDARVVRKLGRSYEYGQVLLAVGERHIRSIPLAASMTGRRSLLEWRIKAMTMKKPRRPMLASIPFAMFAFVAITAAVRVSPPEPLAPISSVSVSVSESDVLDSIAAPVPHHLIAAAPPNTPAPAQAVVIPSSKPIEAGAMQQQFPTRAQIAAMLVANVPALADRSDSSNYAVLVLDANYNFATATAGYGNVTIQVWGDTLDNNGRALRTSQRTGVPVSASRAGGSGARGGGAGAGVTGAAFSRALRPRAMSRDAAAAVATSGGGRGAAGGDGRIAFRRSNDSLVSNRYRETLARRIAVRDRAGAGAGVATGGGRGAGAAAGAASGAIVDSANYTTALVRARAIAVQRSVFRSGDGNFMISGTTSNGPSYGYAAGFTYQRGPDAITGVQATSLTNAATGLHTFQMGVDDDSGINGILASALTSLETFRFESEFGPRAVDVMVVTRK